MVIGGSALLIWSQKKAQQYEEAFKKAMTLWSKREAEPCLAEFRKASKYDGRDPELWVMIGRAESMLGRSDRAGEAWAEALKRDPEYKPALFERGKEVLVRHIAQRLPPAVDAATGWLPQGLQPVGRVQGGADEVARIQADLRAAATHAPDMGRFAKGAFYLLDGHYREAQPHFQAYSEANGWDAPAMALGGIAAHYGAIPDRAESAISAALALQNEKAWLKIRAETRYLQANYDGARADYKEAGLEKEAEPLFARRIPSQALILWLKSDAGVETSGATVSKWADQSGGKHDATISKEGAVGPQLVPSAIRGHPAVGFSEKENELALPDGFEEFDAGVSVFVVGEPQTEPGDPWSFLLLATAVTGAGRIEILLGKRRELDQIVYSVEDVRSKTQPYVKGVPPAKGFEGFSAIHEPSEAVRIYKRGQPAGSGTLALPRKVLRTRNKVGSGLKGQIAEILLYKRSLSELERLGVEAYLKDRYFPDTGTPPPPGEKR